MAAALLAVNALGDDDAGLKNIVQALPPGCGPAPLDDKTFLSGAALQRMNLLLISALVTIGHG